MSKSAWKMVFYSNHAMRFAARHGAYGETAREAAEEVEEEVGPVLAAVFILMILGLVIWGIVSMLS